MSVLDVAHLQKNFGGVRALDDVSLSVAAGEIVALIGPNGAGKSTLFNIVDGRLRADAGTVSFDGVASARRTPERAFERGVGRTFQVAAPFGSMTVKQNVQTALASHTKVRGIGADATLLFAAPAEQLLERVGLGSIADRPVAALAYVELKRLDFALALANEPRLLLLDEPTAGMAEEERLALMQVVRDEAHQRGAAVLFTEHSMDVVFGFATRIVVLARGRVIASGEPSEIANNAAVREVYLGSVDLSGHFA